jgi:hypothetical protein
MVPGRDILPSAALCPLLSLRRMNEPRYPDTCQVQHDHGRGEDAHVHDVGDRPRNEPDRDFRTTGVQCVITNN